MPYRVKNHTKVAERFARHVSRKATPPPPRPQRAPRFKKRPKPRVWPRLANFRRLGPTYVSIVRPRLAEFDRKLGRFGPKLGGFGPKHRQTCVAWIRTTRVHLGRRLADTGPTRPTLGQTRSALAELCQMMCRTPGARIMPRKPAACARRFAGEFLAWRRGPRRRLGTAPRALCHQRAHMCSSACLRCVVMCIMRRVRVLPCARLLRSMSA